MDYKLNLPVGRPPEKAQEQSLALFRIVTRPSSEAYMLKDADFLSHRELEPENKQGKACKAHAVSLFDSLEGAQTMAVQAMSAKRNLGNYIVRLHVYPNAGKCILSNADSGHFSVWLYRDYLNHIEL